RTAIGPISTRCAEADAAACAERHAVRRIALREIALSHQDVPNGSGVTLLWEGPNRTAIGPISTRCAEADAAACAERHAVRRIALRETALSRKTSLERLR
ncbi:MAG: hypothetical protein JJT88_15255, partial [Gammaproteobacteria bacterium]|nr:hypothetical protein [Gammaproteobacteria bacterium]